MLPRWHSGKESPCQCRRCNRHRFDPWVGKIPWSRKWQPTSVFMPGKFHGQRGAWQATVCWVTESDMTKHTCACAHTHSLSLSEFEKCRHLRPQPRILHVCIHAQLLQSCLTLSNTMNCSPPGAFVHGILQARILEWVAISFSRGSHC